MGFRDLLDSTKYMRVILVLWLVSAVMIAFLMYQIDQIVHGDLYNYGLQFNINWAFGYWALERLMAVCLMIPAILSGAALVSSLRRKGESYTQSAPRHEVKSVNGNGRSLKENHMLISCPKCKKVFSKPLAMLDFSGGKTRLVNVCPYCNNVLNSADEKEEDAVQVVDLDQEEQ
jgi:hypothetical protein